MQNQKRCRSTDVIRAFTRVGKRLAGTQSGNVFPVWGSVVMCSAPFNRFVLPISLIEPDSDCARNDIKVRCSHLALTSTFSKTVCRPSSRSMIFLAPFRAKHTLQIPGKQGASGFRSVTLHLSMLISGFRLCLNIKGLHYQTIWVEFPDIEAICKKIGAKPTASVAPFYTLPVIHDPSTNTVISDSIDIARYLDATYPSTTQLFPPGSNALLEAFQIPNLRACLMPIAAPLICAHLNPTSQEYYRRTKEVSLGNRLEDLSPPGPQRDQHWKQLQDSLGAVDSWLSKNGDGKKFVMGDTISYADLTIVGWVLAMKLVFGSESREWKEIASWHNCRWAVFLADFADYLVVVE